MNKDITKQKTSAEQILADSGMGEFEPRMCHQFYVEFPEHPELLRVQVDAFYLGSMNVRESDFANTRIVFREDVSGRVTKLLSNWNKSYDVSYDDATKEININIIDPTGVVVGKWELRDVHLEEVEWGKFAYTTGEPELQKITARLRPGKASFICLLDLPELVDTTEVDTTQELNTGLPSTTTINEEIKAIGEAIAKGLKLFKGLQ